ncbi:DUF4375 domain-containing protein [Planctomyces sp. SH-PL14]|uniref:DMP19 family protein n=1 Tax=Planctomyces sp. SH-PL14 TaxID=1632864 RepID=UPI0009463448|nr:DUF4375 domain-containing protein [Planctomyces sp. SH-PL14]
MIFDGGEAAYQKSLSSLSPEESHLALVSWCDTEVCNGGFHQFFLNSTGMVAPEASKDSSDVAFAEGGVKWTLHTFSEGKRTARVEIPAKSPLSTDIEEAVDLGKSTPDAVNHAPSVLVDSALIRINFLEGKTVISIRKSPSSVWEQRSREPTKSDTRLRAMLLRRAKMNERI